MNNAVKILLCMCALSRTAAFCDEPTDEQLELMQLYHLTVPPIIKDIHGNVKSAVKLPDVNSGPVLERAVILDSPPSKSVTVHAVDGDRKIDVEFSPAEVVDLPPRATPSAAPRVIEVNDDTFDAEVVRYSGMVIVDASAPWCVPCIRMAPVYDAVASTLQNIKCVRIDVDKSPQAKSRMGVVSLPHFTIYDHGVAIASRTGEASADALVQWIGSARGPPATMISAEHVVMRSYSEQSYRAPARRRIYR